jgi:protocatechuate 3,4-dioxygenase beta subunit
MRIWLGLLLASACGFSQSPAAKKPGSVEGTVTDSVTGNPVKKAAVTLAAMEAGSQARPAMVSGVTDAAGHFLIEGVPPGTYIPFANSTGYSIPGNFVRSFASLPTFAVGEEQRVRNVSIKLDPLATLSGRVLDEDGDPVSRAQVQLVTMLTNRGQRKFSPQQAAMTNDLGEYTFENVAAGSYRLRVQVTNISSALPTRLRSSIANDVYPPTYYPNSSVLSGAAVVNAGVGTNLGGLDFKLRRIRGFEVGGHVENLPSGTGAGVNLMEEETGALAPLGSGVDPDGSFLIRAVTPGSYVLRTRVNTPARQYGGSQKLTVSDHNVNDVVLPLLPAVDLVGRVRLEGAASNAAQLFVNAQAVEFGEGSGGTSPNSDGLFTIKNLLPGRYIISVNNVSDKNYVKSIRLGQQDASSGVIDLSFATGEPVELVMAGDPGSIEGVVQTDKGETAAGIAVTAAPREEWSNRTDLFKVTVTAPDGHFKIEGLAPGEYKIIAFEELPFELIQTSSFRKELDSKAATVRVTPASKDSIQLKAVTRDEARVASEKVQ